MQVKKQQFEPNMEQWTGSELEKEYISVVHCHPAYLTYMQSTSCKRTGYESQAEIKNDGENINNLRNIDDATLNARKRRETKRAS